MKTKPTGRAGGFFCCHIADAIEWHFGLRGQPPKDFTPEAL